MSVYDRINLIRKSKGVTWTYLNENVEGTYHGRMTELKNKKTTLSISQLETIARLLGTTTDYLLGNTDDPAPLGVDEKPPAQGGGLNEKDRRLIEWFRSLPPEKQKAILNLGDGPEDLSE